jgi:hypothetical protein
VHRTEAEETLRNRFWDDILVADAAVFREVLRWAVAGQRDPYLAAWARFREDRGRPPSERRLSPGALRIAETELKGAVSGLTDDEILDLLLAGEE